MRSKRTNVCAFIVILFALSSLPCALAWADPAPAIVLETDWGRVEITLSSPGEVETMFFDRRNFNDPELQAKLDMAAVGALKQKLGGVDSGVAISPDKHHATLKHGQQVYWGMWLKDGAIGKTDAVTIVMKTVPQWGYPDIVRNGFEIAYTEPIGTGVGVGNTDIRTDSTFGKSFQVFNLPAARVTYFSFKARVCSGGVRTEFSPHFFKGPSLTGVTPDNVTCCCHDTHELLLPVPECYYSLWQAAQVDCRYWCKLYYFLKCFREKLACRVKQATDAIANAPCADPQATIELTITGDHLPKMTLAEAQEHVKITPVRCPSTTDEFRIVEVVVSTHDTLTLKVEIVKCNPGIHQIAIDGVGGIATFTTNKVITVAPDVLVRRKVFDAVRVVGSQERLPISLNMDGEVMAIAPAEWQLLSPTPATEATATQATSTSTGTAVNFIAATGQAKSRAEDTPIGSTVADEQGCAPPQKVWIADLEGLPLENTPYWDWHKIMEVDIDNPYLRRRLSSTEEDDNAADNEHDDDREFGVKPSTKDPGLYVGLNADDDNRNGLQDRYEAPVNDSGQHSVIFKEDDLQLAHLNIQNARPDQKVTLEVSKAVGRYGFGDRGRIRIWGNRKKEGPVILDASVTGNGRVTLSVVNGFVPLWIEGVEVSNSSKDITLIARTPPNEIADTMDITVIGPTVQKNTERVGVSARTQHGCVYHADEELIQTPEKIRERARQLYVYVYAPEYARLVLQKPVRTSVNVFSYDLSGKYWHWLSRTFAGVVEISNRDSLSVQAPRVTRTTVDEEFLTDEDGGFFIVNDGRLFLQSSSLDNPSAVPGVGGGRAIVRLFSYLKPQVGIRPPGWLVNVIDADLDIDGVEAEQEFTPGAVVVRNFDNNHAPRKKVTIRKVVPETFLGDVILSRQLNDRLKVFTAATAGTEIAFNGTDNRFTNASLPRDVYVEGFNYSDTMRDTGLILTAGGLYADVVNFTVLWVDQPTVAFSGTLSTENAKKDEYREWTKNNSYQLGLQLYDNDKLGKRMGWGVEGKGRVHPANFEDARPYFEDPVMCVQLLKLDQDVTFRDYIGDGQLFSSYSGTDIGGIHQLDQNPAPNGFIYMWDAPGLLVPSMPQGQIRRTRNNFLLYASITIDGVKIRCSPVLEYFVRFSMKQLDAPEGRNWVVLDPLDIPGDNEKGYGTTSLEWDLK